MKSFRYLAPLIAFAGTGLLLVADSAQHCNHKAETVRYAVSNSTCGSSGLLTVTSGTDECEVRAEGADSLGFPARGYVGDKLTIAGGGWKLVQYLPTDGGLLADGGHQPSSRICEVSGADPTLTIDCADSIYGSVKGSPCQATLTRQ